MILLDTHIWVFWMTGAQGLSAGQQAALDAAGPGEIGVSPISCWEIGQLVSRGRLTLSTGVADWVDAALTHPNVRVVSLTPPIEVASTTLPDLEHKDPADRFLIATARALGCPLLTNDRVILDYPHVATVD
ncbi:MAG TPA: type II toxin-antitoxin system VapC family toxin [Tepidisphaeraceae bacterium]|nr:type II toxin-antitoxin system VapC family toxin [Tepidisphaeraceae bacterium]